MSLQINRDFIKKLIDEKIVENIIYEYKKEVDNNSKEIAKDISAMANSEGGYIFYGIEENNDGSPKTIVPIEATQKVPERIEQIINTTIHPNLIVNIHDIDYDNKKVFVVEIPKSHQLHMVIKEHDNRYYKRTGRTNTPMEHSEIINTLKSNIEFEKSIISKVNDLEKIFIENSGVDLDKTNYINIYVFPRFVGEVYFAENLISFVDNIEGNKPVMGGWRDCFKSSAVLRNTPSWDRFLQIFLNGKMINGFFYDIIDHDKTFYEPTFEFKRIAGFMYWLRKLFKKSNYFGGFELVVKIKNINKYYGSQTHSNPDGIYIFNQPQIIESIYCENNLSDDVIKEKSLQLIKKIGSYYGVSSLQGYDEVVKLKVRTLEQMLNHTM
jgi:hypothetical protein